MGGPYKNWIKFHLPPKQSCPQLPQFPAPPPIWIPESSTNVEHQGLMSPSALPAVVHWWYVIPLNLKGKIHNAFGFGPLAVEQFKLPPVMKMRCS